MVEITDDLIDKIEILSKIKLNENERIKAKIDMEKMLEYIDILGEVEIGDVIGATHFNKDINVFREDDIYEYENFDVIVNNAPEANEGMFVVPKTV